MITFKPGAITENLARNIVQQNLATVRLDTVRNSIKRGNLTCLCLILLFLCIKNLNTMRFDTTRTSI